MEKRCKKCKKIIQGKPVISVVHKYFGKKDLGEEIREYCSVKCAWEHDFGK